MKPSVSATFYSVVQLRTVLVVTPSSAAVAGVLRTLAGDRTSWLSGMLRILLLVVMPGDSVTGRRKLSLALENLSKIPSRPFSSDPPPPGLRVEGKGRGRRYAASGGATGSEAGSQSPKASR
jgi:hypothetical protein